LATTTDGRTIAVSGGVGLQLWNMSDPARPQPIEVPADLETSRIYELAMAPDGRTLAVAGDSLTLWSLLGDKVISRGRPLRGHTGAATGLAFAPDGSALFSAGDRTLISWSLDAGDLARPVGPPLPGSGTVFSSDGRTLVSRASDTSVELRDAADPLRISPVAAPLALPAALLDDPLLSGDGRLLATPGLDNSVMLWDLTDPDRPRAAGDIIRVAPPPPPITESGAVVTAPERGRLHSVALSPDGSTLAVAQGELGTTLWDLTDRASPRPLGEPFTLTGQGEFSTDLAFSPDGGRLAIGYEAQSTLWDLTDRAHPQPLGSGVDGDRAQFLPDGQTLATVTDGGIALWDLTDAARPRALGVPFGGPAFDVAFSQDGRTLAILSEGASPSSLWDLTDRARPRLLGELPVRDVSSVSFAPNGRTLAVTSYDSSVLLDISLLDQFRRDPIGEACARAGGPLDPGLWSLFASGLEYQDTCAR
jgi:WD40 repeat protein